MTPSASLVRIARALAGEPTARALRGALGWGGEEGGPPPPRISSTGRTPRTQWAMAPRMGRAVGAAAVAAAAAAAACLALCCAAAGAGTEAPPPADGAVAAGVLALGAEHAHVVPHAALRDAVALQGAAVEFTLAFAVLLPVGARERDHDSRGEAHERQFRSLLFKVRIDALSLAPAVRAGTRVHPRSR